jgi:L-amino acid N-acyltransferase YncA
MIIRPATPADAPAMTSILNAIIAIGGTTAHESPKTEAAVEEDYITGPDVLAASVAEIDGAVIGWQSVGWYHGNPEIGTFVQPGTQARGIGAQLFALTCATLRRAGITYIIATIRADNVPGLAYYARSGFRDIGHDPDFTLLTGQKVGRVTRRIDLS